MKPSQKVTVLIIVLLLGGLLLSNWKMRVVIDQADLTQPFPFYEPVAQPIRAWQHLKVAGPATFTLAKAKQWGLRAHPSARPYLKFAQRGDTLVVWLLGNLSPEELYQLQAQVAIDLPAEAAPRSLAVAGEAVLETNNQRVAEKIAQKLLFQSDTLHLRASDKGQMDLEGIKARAVVATLRDRAKISTWLGQVDYLDLDMTGGSELFAPMTGFGQVKIKTQGGFCSAHLNGGTLARLAQARLE
jgi:hypothetical protein